MYPCDLASLTPATVRLDIASRDPIGLCNEVEEFAQGTLHCLPRLVGVVGAEQWAAYVDEDKDYSKWTVLREGDGGRHVHELQTALVHQGFWPGEDDMLWWQFGGDTCSAVQTFQVCDVPVC